jgi:hypothetical protein
VGDLYTDPQIHTETGTDFGDGNLGRLDSQPLSTETMLPLNLQVLWKPWKQLRQCLGSPKFIDMGAWEV